MRRVHAAAAAVALVLTGCSAEPSADDVPEGSVTGAAADGRDGSGGGPSPSRDALVLEIDGGRIEPNGQRVTVAVGRPVRMRVTSDRAAELHVHSSPDQVLAVQPGTSTLTLTIDRPGLVDVEEHDTGFVVFRLEVR